MIAVVVWKWRKNGYRSQFSADTVNTAFSQWRRRLRIPHNFICVTDDEAGIDYRIQTVNIRSLSSYKYMDVPNPSSHVNPSCYVRLFIFSEEAKTVLGERIVSADLDMVLTDDVTPLIDRDDDFVIWGGQTVQPGSAVVYNWFNGSLMMLRAGTRTQVWSRFNPRTSPREAHRAGCRGSDQGWISHILGRREKIWGVEDGVYSFRNHILPNGGSLPKGARVVAFHGKHDPWHLDVQRQYPWIREHYR